MKITNQSKEILNIIKIIFPQFNDFKNIGGVYTISNTYNNKVYVGSSSCTRGITERIKQHIRSLINNKHHSIKLQRAWNKYPLNYWKIDIVETCHKDKCLELEQFYLDKLCKKDNKINSKISYNICTTAGSSFGLYKIRPIYKIDKSTLEIVAKYDSIYTASLEENVFRENLYGVCVGKRISAKNNYWCFVEDYESWKPLRRKSLSKSNLRGTSLYGNIEVYNKKGEKVHTFKNVPEAAKQLNIASSNIYQNLKNKLNWTGGYNFIPQYITYYGSNK